MTTRCFFVVVLILAAVASRVKRQSSVCADKDIILAAFSPWGGKLVRTIKEMCWKALTETCNCTTVNESSSKRMKRQSSMCKDVLKARSPWDGSLLRLANEDCCSEIIKNCRCNVEISKNLSEVPTSLPDKDGKPQATTTAAPGKPETRPTKKRYVVLPDELRNWDDAQARCQERGQRLASVRSKEEQAQLEQVLQSFTSPINGVWLSTNDRAQYNKFTWKDGSNDPVTFSHWESGSPPIHETPGKNCVFASYVAFVNKQQAFWFIQRCSDVYNFVCESMVK